MKALTLSLLLVLPGCTASQVLQAAQFCAVAIDLWQALDGCPPGRPSP